MPASGQRAHADAHAQQLLVGVLLKLGFDAAEQAFGYTRLVHGRAP